MMHEAERVRLARQRPRVLLAANDGLLLISGISRGRTGGAVTLGSVTALPATAACQALSYRGDVVRGEGVRALGKPKSSEAGGEKSQLVPGGVSPGMLQA